MLVHSLENYEIILFALPKAHERIIEHVGSFIDLLHHAVLALCLNYYFHNRLKGSQVEFQMPFLAPTKPNACVYYSISTTSSTLTIPSTLTLTHVASEAVVGSRSW